MKSIHLLKNNHYAIEYLRLRFLYDIIVVTGITNSVKMIIHCIEREIMSKYILSSKTNRASTVGPCLSATLISSQFQV